ncbi:MAG TPA: helix-turn-helix transcriptional regulator [Candidatus Acidoferrum sp.]|nr:helix-turn-helix transcriptional regulator [Candidatus Acidoferrum sp.]
MRLTKLEKYLRKRKVKPAHLAHVSGYSRQHLLRIRSGTMEPTRPCIKAITQACGRITGKPVKAADLFDLDD